MDLECGPLVEHYTSMLSVPTFWFLAPQWEKKKRESFIHGGPENLLVPGYVWMNEQVSQKAPVSTPSTELPQAMSPGQEDLSELLGVWYKSSC